MFKVWSGYCILETFRIIMINMFVVGVDGKWNGVNKKCKTKLKYIFQKLKY